MLHFAIHARPGLWLFHDHVEARALWDRLVAVTAVHHLCLMPDHAHGFTRRIPTLALRGAMSGHARWLAHRRDEPSLKLWLPYDQPAVVTNPEHLQRTRRYVLLNPCRGRLVDDPLAWPWSTHRDATGLTWPRARKLMADPADFHAYVSRDHSVRPDGTDLPSHRLDIDVPSYEQVEAAVSAVTRTPVQWLRTRPGPRRKMIQCLRTLTDIPVREIARRLGVSKSQVGRTHAHWDELTSVVDRVIGDGRFDALWWGDLRDTEAWDRYQRYLWDKRRARRNDLCG